MREDRPRPIAERKPMGRRLTDALGCCAPVAGPLLVDRVAAADGGACRRVGCSAFIYMMAMHQSGSRDRRGPLATNGPTYLQGQARRRG
jgi:hypothetical protein